MTSGDNNLLVVMLVSKCLYIEPALYHLDVTECKVPGVTLQTLQVAQVLDQLTQYANTDPSSVNTVIP